MPKIDRASLRKDFVSKISSVYDVREATAIFFMVAEQLWGTTRNDFIINPSVEVECNTEEIDKIIDALCRNVPIQHILGFAQFCDMTFEVNSNVLIPRPETQELVNWVVSSIDHRTSLLDIGTGSGAIAVAVAKMSRLNVYAIDVSSVALEVAERNALSNDVAVEFTCQDILRDEPAGKYDIIVSNPPYIPRSDKPSMALNVVDYEPDVALFVDEQDPLLFYRRIAEVGCKVLSDDGLLFFEIYEHFAPQISQMLKDMGYNDVQVRSDIHSKERMIRCSR